MTTLGTKLRAARTAVGMTQEELATKLCVSRQAVTKWEADKGMPDIANLRAAAALFNVSIDYLVADSETAVATTVREPVGEWKSYVKKGKARKHHDAVVQAFYPHAARITPLIMRRTMPPWRWIFDLTLLGWGGTEAIASLGGPSVFYLVDLGSQQLIVSVTKEFIEAQELTVPFTGKTLEIGDQRYRRGFYSF